MSELESHNDVINNLFTHDSSTENIILFMKNVFEIEKKYNIDLVNFIKAFSGKITGTNLKLDVVDCLDIVKSFNKNHLVLGSFLKENKKYFDKYNIDYKFFENYDLENISVESFMKLTSVYGKKRNYDMISEKDFQSIIPVIPTKLINPNIIAMSELMSEVASFYITKPSLSEITIHINDEDDVSVNIDVSMLLHNIRKSLKSNPEKLRLLKDKNFSIEISNKISKGIMQHISNIECKQP